MEAGVEVEFGGDAAAVVLFLEGYEPDVRERQTNP